MIYTVVSLPQADQALAAIWRRAANRQAVTDAANRIERALKRDAHNKGQPFGDERIIIDDPLAVTFTVRQPDCLVTITWVMEN